MNVQKSIPITVQLGHMRYYEGELERKVAGLKDQVEATRFAHEDAFRKLVEASDRLAICKKRIADVALINREEVVNIVSLKKNTSQLNCHGNFRKVEPV